MDRKSAALFAFALLFAGCHVCKPVEESKECFPLCKEKRNENRILTEEGWNRFKHFRPLPYRSVGIPLIDNSARIISKLSIQIAQEIVIPYVELDKDRLIQTYYQFTADAKGVQKQQNCSIEQAVTLTWQEWEKQPNGVENCAKLKRAIPFIRNMRAGNQIQKAVFRIGGDVERLLRTLPYQIKQLERVTKTTEGKIKLGIAGAQITLHLTYLGTACAYLSVLKSDVAEQEKQIEVFVAKINAL